MNVPPLRAGEYEVLAPDGSRTRYRHGDPAPMFTLYAPPPAAAVVATDPPPSSVTPSPEPESAPANPS